MKVVNPSHCLVHDGSLTSSQPKFSSMGYDLHTFSVANRVLRWMRYIIKHLKMLTVHDHRLHLSCAWFWSSDGKSFHQAVKGDWCLLIDVATLTLDRTQDDTRHFDILFNSFAMTSEVTVESKQNAGCGFRMDAAWISRSPGRFRSWTSLTA